MDIDDIDTLAVRLLDGARCVETIPDTDVGPSPIHGLGLFARRSWAAGDLLCRLDGQAIDVGRHPGVSDALEWNALGLQRLLVRPLRTSHGFINHARHPSVAVDDDGYGLRACLPITPGEELTMDYFAQPIPPAYLASDEAARLHASS